jgi:predicted AAA+ superfamily ATPase
MAEEIKEKIIRFLTQFPDDKFTLKELRKMTGKISYPTILKWVTVLEAERRIRIDDYGNMKLIYLNKELVENATHR